MNERLVAYDTSFDRLAYQTVKEKEVLNAYTRKQLETHLGERLNVLLSSTRYEIINEQIYGQDTAEPFMDSLIRGRNYRRLSGNPIDFDRENAEVIGFSKIQEQLTSQAAQVGTMMLSVSPKGAEDSTYQHNFYDVFTLKRDDKGKYIEAKRYSSGLSIDETAEKLKEGMLLYSEEVPTPEQFLENPIVVNNPFFETAEDIHKFLHKEHKYTRKEEFDKGLRMVGFLITSYVNGLSENLSSYEINLRLNAVVNGFDIAMGESKDRLSHFKNVEISTLLNSNEYVRYLGNQPVRPVMTGCGFSGNMPNYQGVFIPGQNKTAFSVAEFAVLKDRFGKRTFDCPDCGKENLRPENQMIGRCQHCSSAKVAC